MSGRKISADEQASYAHVFRHSADLPAEHSILAEVLKKSSRVLDVGTGASGRSAKLVRSFQPANLVSIEINIDAIKEFGRSDDRAGIELAAGDLVDLPFADGSFDVVLIAFHGMDYVLDRVVRANAFREVERVLAPGGTFIVNSWNRVGILCSPYGLASKQSVKARLRYVVTGDVLRNTLLDDNGLRLHQSTPRRSIREVESETGLKHSWLIDSFAKSNNEAFVTLTSMEPYFVFKCPSA